MPLKLCNTLTRRKEDFVPLDRQNVRMYVCGPTVYDFAHIGNARPVVVFDVLFRLLRHLYGPDHVTYVRNITDVDDKINARAREENVPIRDLTERTARQFQEDIAALGVLPPTHEPRATEYVGPMIELIERLIAKGNAYPADGHVLFDVTSMKDYGRLSRRSLDEMMAGARIDVAPYKKGDMDFVLWKPSDKDTPGWDSPWGRGRPGWHIECSAMSWKLLGETFDIHGGGIDLVFPHHENELAQTRCVFGHKLMANVWMHNGFLQVEGQKMSKSQGNFVTINELLTNWNGVSWPGEAIRFLMLMTHYRQPIDWTHEGLDRSHKQLWEMYQAIDSVSPASTPSSAVVEALCDDLNTPKMLAELSRLAKSGAFPELAASLKFLGFSCEISSLLRLQFSTLSAGPGGEYRITGGSAQVYVRRDDGTVELDSHTKARVDSLISARLAARKAKNWVESDRIRDELAAMGVAIKDNKDGTTTWEIKR